MYYIVPVPQAKGKSLRTKNPKFTIFMGVTSKFCIVILDLWYFMQYHVCIMIVIGEGSPPNIPASEYI